MPASQHLRTFSRSGLQVAGNLVHLFLGGLGTHLHVRVERVAHAEVLHTFHCQLEELIGNILVHQGAGRAGTHFTLVESEHGEAFNGLGQVIVVLVHHIGEEDIGRFSTEFESDGDDFVCGHLVDELAHWSGPCEGDLVDATRANKRGTCFLARTVDHVQHPGWDEVTNEVQPVQDGCGRLLSWFHHGRTS